MESISGRENHNTAVFRKGLWVPGSHRHMKTAHKESVRKGSASSVVLVTVVPVLLNAKKPLEGYKREGRKYKEAPEEIEEKKYKYLVGRGMENRKENRYIKVQVGKQAASVGN